MQVKVTEAIYEIVKSKDKKPKTSYKDKHKKEISNAQIIVRK